MGAFICQISEKDWNISREKGVYGNREKKPDYTGPLRDCDLMSVIRDLSPINIGDYIFFHVVKKENDKDSSIHGVFRARSQSFYESNIIWDNPNETFPYRFLFEPHPKYIELCSNDSHIYVSDLYREIESRRIWSIATLENERNMERRAVRKISKDDAKTITELLLREYKIGESINFLPYISLNNAPIEEKIIKVESIENSVKAIFLSKLKNRDPSLSNIFGNVYDYMNETFIAQTTRKLIDLLCISKNENGRIYYIIEAKSGTVNFSEGHLRQFLTYLDLFKQKSLVNPNKDLVIGGILFRKCDEKVIHAVSQLNEMNIFDGIKFIKFDCINNNNVIFSELNNIQNILLFENQSLPIYHLDSFNLDMILNKDFSSLIYCYDQSEKTEDILIIREKIKDESSNWEFNTKCFFIKKYETEVDIAKLLIFLTELKTFVGEEYNHDYMKVTPVLIGPIFNEEVKKKIEIYNNYLSRPTIKLFSNDIQ